MSYVGQSVHHTILVGASIVLAPDELLLGTVLAQEIKSYSSVVSNTETVPDQNSVFAFSNAPPHESKQNATFS